VLCLHWRTLRLTFADSTELQFVIRPMKTMSHVPLVLSGKLGKVYLWKSCVIVCTRSMSELVIFLFYFESSAVLYNKA